MRVGNNPNKGKSAQSMPPVLATVTTHLPGLDGYHSGRLEVVQTCLTTMRRYSGVPVMVWDNGSCAALRDWLRDDYKPDYLILSPNLGKHQARAAMARMVKPETVISFCDDDMLFFPGWWDESLKILRAFPQVGAVSAWPLKVSKWAIDSVLEFARDNAVLETGDFIPMEHEIQYARSVGISVSEHTRRVSGMKDLRVFYQGLRAMAQAQHCQFMTIAERIAPLCDYNPMLLTGERAFDDAIDSAKLLRLCTTERYALHMGNVIDEELKGIIEKL